MKTTPFLLVICVLCAAFPGFAQGTPPADQAPHSLINSPSPGFTIMGELMSLSGEIGMECRKCNLDTPTGNSQAPHFSLILLTDELSRVKTVLQRVQQKWPMVIESLTVKPNFDLSVSSSSIEISLDLSLPPDGNKSTMTDLDTILKPVQDLPFFLPFADQNLSQPHLFGFSLKDAQPVHLQVVFESLAAVQSLLAQPLLPGKSRTISRTRFGSKDLITVNFSNAEDTMPTKDLLAIYSTLSEVGQVRELTMPPGSKQLVISLSMSADKFGSFIEVMAPKAGLEPEKSEIALEGAGIWSLTMVTNLTKAPQKLVTTDLQPLLSATFPPQIQDGIKISWNPHKISFSVEIPVNPEVSSPEGLAQLKALAASLGFSPEGSRVDKSKDTGEERLFLSFGKETGPAGQRSAKTVSKGLQDVLDQSEILENIQTPQGRKQAIRLPFVQVYSLVSALSQVTTQRLISFHLTCVHPNPATVEFVLADGEASQSKSANRILTALMKAPLPWNLPEDSLKQGLLVQTLSLQDNGDFELSGVTLKSRLIFSSLFPVLQAIPGISEPFFSQGTYQDHPLGRLMTFRVTAQCLDSK